MAQERHRKLAYAVLEPDTVSRRDLVSSKAAFADVYWLMTAVAAHVHRSASTKASSDSMGKLCQLVG